MFGDPGDRQINGRNEAWTYADVVGLNEFRYSVIWFADGNVFGVTTYRQTGTRESGFRTIDWARAPARPSESVPASSSDQQVDDGTRLVGTGSGFLVGNSGFMLTNFHVVKGGKRFRVRLAGSDWDAQVVSTDESSDVALLKVALTTAITGLVIDLSPVSLGQSVYTIGYPNPTIQGIEPKYTSGEISSLRGVADDIRYMQVSVPLQPGNSGGPLLSKDGEVLGIVSARLSDNKVYSETGSLPQNVNYAVKISRAIPLLLDAGVSTDSANGAAPRSRTINEVSSLTGLISVYQ